MVWDDPEVDWSEGLVAVRSTWDYERRLEEFLAWSRQLPRVLNSSEVFPVTVGLAQWYAAATAGSGGQVLFTVVAAGALVSIESPRVARLSLTIARDGVVVASKAFVPKYSYEELNGPGCGTCASASDTL